MSVQLLTNLEHATTEKINNNITKHNPISTTWLIFRMYAFVYGWKYLHQRKKPNQPLNDEYSIASTSASTPMAPVPYALCQCDKVIIDPDFVTSSILKLRLINHMPFQTDCYDLVGS